MTALLPEGLADRLPPEAEALAQVEARVLAAASAYGYERVDPPLAEFADGLTTRLKAGGLHGAVRFVDPVSQRTLAIRPDMTAQVARIAATRLAHHPRPLRLSYAGTVLSLRASELAPARERRQIGCELIGHDTVVAAREVVGVAAEALVAAGASAVSVDFTLPDLVATLANGSRPVAEGQRAALAERLDAKDAAAVAALAPEYLPLIAATGPLASALEQLRALDDGTLTSRLDAVAALADALDGRATVTLDPTERHGFEYQSWLGFSLYADGREAGRGGSYTVLHEDGREEPAVGFTLFAGALVVGEAVRGRRVFLPLGTPGEVGAWLRGEGWVTVAAFVEHDSAAAQLCEHTWRDGAVAAA